MTIPVPVLLHLYDTLERMKLEQRAEATQDHVANAGVNSEAHHKALMERVSILERLAAGEPPSDYTGDTT